jgi:hypothetical protein
MCKNIHESDTRRACEMESVPVCCGARLSTAECVCQPTVMGLWSEMTNTLWSLREHYYRRISTLHWRGSQCGVKVYVIPTWWVFEYGVGEWSDWRESQLGKQFETFVYYQFSKFPVGRSVPELSVCFRAPQDEVASSEESRVWWILHNLRQSRLQDSILY